jgi:hypothetical protein
MVASRRTRPTRSLARWIDADHMDDLRDMGDQCWGMPNLEILRYPG